MEDINPQDRGREIEVDLEPTQIERFTGDPKNVDEILRYAEKAGYTHIGVPIGGDVYFASEDEATTHTYMTEHPENFLSLASPEVQRFVEEQIEKGFHFGAQQMNLIPD